MTSSSSPAVKPLSPVLLLLSLPALLAHPPTHPLYIPSLVSSFLALRKLMSLNALTPDIECRACTGLAELGLKIINDGLNRNEAHDWAGSNIESEVEKAIARGLQLSQTNPSLAIHKQTLLLLHASLAIHQQNYRFSRTLLKRIIGTRNDVSSSTWIIYTAYLTSVSYALAQTPPEIQHALSAVDDLITLSQRRQDFRVTLLCNVLRLRLLVDAGMWDQVGEALLKAETVLGLSYSPPSTPNPKRSPEKASSTRASPTKSRASQEQVFVMFDDPLEVSMALHVLIIGVAYHTHLGMASEASPRLSHFHALLDSEALAKFPEGVLNISLANAPPLSIESTHPATLYQLAFLTSSIAKRDVVGRKPKRKAFAVEGLKIWESEIKKEILLTSRASRRDEKQVQDRMVKIRADLLSELVAVCIMRSELDDVKSHLASLIAHTRAFDIFPLYAPVITLHHAHFAHALGETLSAVRYYQVTAHLAKAGSYLHMAALAGELEICIGVNGMARGLGSHKTEADATERYMWDHMLQEMLDAYSGNGGTLTAIEHIFEASLSSEIMLAKSHLRTALDLASRSQDNYLRAFILALIASLYLRTSEGHAQAMLETCGQLAVGLGASAIQNANARTKTADLNRQRFSVTKDPPSGNVQLCSWVGERFSELYRQSGNESKAHKQDKANLELTMTVDWLKQRHSLFFQQ